MAEISVIVPVYKAEAFLPSCIESILNQSFSDFELILVDDGSPDGCGAICEEFAKKDPRITVLHQENQGQSAARNHALEIAQTPWVSFVDSDDLIHPQTLELLYRAAGESGAPMSMCRMLEATELPEDFMAPREGAFRLYTMDDETVASMYDSETYPAWVSCGKLIRREVIDTHLFCPGRVYEDNEAVCHWIVAAGALAEIPEDLYFYRTNFGSTTQSRFSLKKLDFLWALEGITSFYGSVGYAKTRQRFLDRYIQETITHYCIARFDLNRRDVAARIKKGLGRYLKAEKIRLTGAQFERLLDAMHPKLIRLYWPLAGMARTLREEGARGMARKLSKHLGGK